MQERAVIWRLMGEYEKALKEFDALLTFEEDYECLVQASYLKGLTNDESGALKYARRARELKRPELEQFGHLSKSLMTLGVNALPKGYRRWWVLQVSSCVHLFRNITVVHNPEIHVTPYHL